MINIKKAKLSKIGNSYYIRVPIEFIKTDLLDPKDSYNVVIEDHN